MLHIFNKYKKICILAAVVLSVALLIIYLRALFLPGIWHGNAFLYLQDDGSFAGYDVYAEYSMDIKQAEYGADITFSVNDTEKYYQIIYDNDINGNVKVLENGNEIFDGRAVGQENDYILISQSSEASDMISIRVGNEIPAEEELFPGYTRLYNWAVTDHYDTRGNPLMLFFILVLGIVLFLDVKFPDLFWILEHRLEVDGGEPSDWYRFSQRIGYILLPVGILICVILTFTMH